MDDAFDLNYNIFFVLTGSKNYSNIYPPSSTLHLSNIPTTVEEFELREAFSAHGLIVQGFKFFPKDRKMALVQLASVEDAVTGLMKMHNYQVRSISNFKVDGTKQFYFLFFSWAKQVTFGFPSQSPPSDPSAHDQVQLFKNLSFKLHESPNLNRQKRIVSFKRILMQEKV